ncbi:MAG TPA: AsnC family transcriptional regulator [Thermoplasmata archaeon]|nr:AsnC family transcriptional regulator [Thermoplasmata archaeon]
MDSLDVRILRLLLQGHALSPLNPDFRESYAAIAKAVTVDEDTVRYRVRKLHDTGFLADWRLALNPRIWGGGQLVLILDLGSDSSMDDAVEELKLVPGVVIITRFYGRIALVLEYEDACSLPRQIELIRRISAATGLFAARYRFPDCTVVLSARDWDLIRALRRSPRKSCASLAKEVGLSSPTVKRKLRRLTSEGVAFAWPSLNLKGTGGSVIAWIFVLYPNERKQEVDEAVTADLESYIWHISHYLPYNPGEFLPTSYELAVPSLQAAREALRWVRDIPGVETAHLDLYEDIFTNFEWYDEDLGRKLRQMPTSMPTVEAGTYRKRVIALEHQ